RCGVGVGRVAAAARPVVLAGTGVRCAGAVEVFRDMVDRLGVPVATAWTHDTIPSDHPFYCGCQGSIGDRAGNFAVQNADLLLVLGSRLCLRQISYNWESFSRASYKIQVDADAAELQKPTVRPDLAIHCDLRLFLEVLRDELVVSRHNATRYRDWVAWCKERQGRYPVVQAHQRQFRGALNPYHF